MSQLLLAPLERFFDGPADDEPDRKAIAATLERAFAGDDPRDRPYAALNFLQDLAARQAREQAGDRALEQKRLDEVPRDRQGPLFVGLSASGVDRDFYYRYRNDSPERLSELREQAQKEFAAQFPDLKFDDLHRAYYQARQSFNAAERIGARVKSLRDQGYTGEELEDRLPFL
ncbi:MAG: hypothetical protein JNM56_04940, partial [Planctomycetia bacterium]|nr:hypothetical protein [Planctomycetia bacterium]